MEQIQNDANFTFGLEVFKKQIRPQSTRT